MGKGGSPRLASISGTSQEQILSQESVCKGFIGRMLPGETRERVKEVGQKGGGTSASKVYSAGRSGV